MYHSIKMTGFDASAVGWIGARHGFEIGEGRFLLHAVESRKDVRAALGLTVDEVAVEELTRERYEELSRAAKGIVIESPFVLESK